MSLHFLINKSYFRTLQKTHTTFVQVATSPSLPSFIVDCFNTTAGATPLESQSGFKKSEKITHLIVKMPIKSIKMKISKNKKVRFILISQGSFNPKIRFLGQKVCPYLVHGQTHTHTQTDRHTLK